jgi:hypothetical protein
VPDLRTTVTELVTGLGMLGFDTVADALRARPRAMVSVAPERWDTLERAHDGGGLAPEFERAWSNGRAFLGAPDGLRGRLPRIVEWKGSHRAPGDEVAPIDLRIDHVFLVSCKYLSKIMINASPAHLFDRLLQGAHGIRSGDWYQEVAGEQYEELYTAVRAELELDELPRFSADLRPEDRKLLAVALSGSWPGASAERYRVLAQSVAAHTASRWQARLQSPADAEQMLWRVLRMGSAPYFVLGSSPAAPLRLRVATPWDWRLDYRLRSFSCAPQPGGQPRVSWSAAIEDRHSRVVHEVVGHVEIRWSHGRFSGNPEAKLYLDSPHRAVPGYYPLEPEPAALLEPGGAAPLDSVPRALASPSTRGWSPATESTNPSADDARGPTDDA